MSRLLARNPWMLTLCLLLLSAAVTQAQPPIPPEKAPEKTPDKTPEKAPEKTSPPLPVIADEPKLIDPATVMPAPLAAKATVDLTDSSLREVVQWLRDERKLTVLLDNGALNAAGVLAGEPVADKLIDAPIYLLLNRLRSLDLAWYYEDEILHITTAEAAAGRLTTLPYNIGDLLDSGYERDELLQAIQRAVAPNDWEELGGNGVLSFLGDVLFVRQTQTLHRQVSGLLAALRKHGRQTYVLDPPAHLLLREKLQQPVTVNLKDVPLDEAVKQLAALTKADIRLDLTALRELRVRERQPITLNLAERKLQTVLLAMVVDLDLTWSLQDGVLWITGKEHAQDANKTAVYDVRDLSRNESESDALLEAITSQTNSATWDDLGGPGTIRFARPGTLVVYNSEDLHEEVLQLLETYRTALRASKPRVVETDDPQEIITTYYRMHANVAEDLAVWLPRLVQPESWQNEHQPQAKGVIHRLASAPDVSSDEAKLAGIGGNSSDEVAQVVARSVLIIRQTRAAHEEIQEVIRRVQGGDSWGVDLLDPFGNGKIHGLGGGLGGGGFGGGYFAVPNQTPTKRSR